MQDRPLGMTKAKTIERAISITGLALVVFSVLLALFTYPGLPLVPLFAGLSLIFGVKTIQSIKTREGKTQVTVRDAFKVFNLGYVFAAFPTLVLVFIIIGITGDVLTPSGVFLSTAVLTAVSLLPFALLLIVAMTYARRVNGLSL